MERQVENAVDFRLDLIGTAEYVGVILCHPSNPKQTVQHPTALESVHRAQLSDAHGQVSVAAHARLVVHDVEGAVHGPQVVVLPIHVHGGEHALLEELQVSAGFPQRRPTDVGRIHEVVARLVVLLFPEILDDTPDARAFGVPDDEARPDLVMDGEEVELSAEKTVVAPARLLEAFEVLVQGLLRLEGRSVDSLEHGPVLIAPPVGAGHAQQLERGNLARRLHVGTGAEVLELPVAVGRYRLVLRDFPDDLELEGLFRVQLQGGVASVLPVLKRQIGGHDLLHPPLYRLEVLGCKSLL